MRDSRNEHQMWNRKVKELVEESNMRVDEEVDMKMNEKLIESEDKKLFCKCQPLKANVN